MSISKSKVYLKKQHIKNYPGLPTSDPLQLQFMVSQIESAFKNWII